MTRVTILHERGETTFRANGHADTVEGCAAVSTLMGSLHCYITNCGGVVESWLSPGDAIVRYTDVCADTRVVTRYVATAFLQLQESGVVEIAPESNLGEIFDDKML